MEVMPLGVSVLSSAGFRVGAREGDCAKVPIPCALEV